MKSLYTLLAAVSSLTLSSTLSAKAPIPSSYDWDSARPDSHAPIGVMGDHTHAAGEFMLSYRYMLMPMAQNFRGNDSVSDASVLRDFMVVPTNMDMEMHMMGLMFAPSDRITLGLMAPYSRTSMDHLRRDGKRFTTESEGWGDLSLTGLVSIYDRDATRAHLNLGVGLPTGETDASDVIPGLGVTRLPYPMQLGSGSWSLRPGLTIQQQHNRWSWGAQAVSKIHLDDNDEGYQLGDSVEASLWASALLSDRLSSSLRLTGRHWGDIEGSDRNLQVPLGAVPTANPALRGGSQIEVGLGFNYLLGGGHRLGVEALLPIHRNLDGPQLGSEWTLQAGWQYSF